MSASQKLELFPFSASSCWGAGSTKHFQGVTHLTSFRLVGPSGSLKVNDIEILPEYAAVEVEEGARNFRWADFLNCC